MTTATSFLEVVTEVQDDIATVSSFSDNFGTLLDASEEILDVPGDLEDMLREPADAIDLPDPLMAVLGLVPFGIGTALKTIDRISEATADVIEQQADIMGALDDALATPRSVVSVVQPANSLLGGATTAASFVNAQMQEEAVRLGESLGDQTIEVGSGLLERMEAYEASAQEWFDTRDDLLAPFRAASDVFENALDELESLLPGTDLFEDASDAILAVMQPIKDAAEAFENAICIDFTITPEIVVPGTPAITVTPAIPPVYGTNPFTGNKFVIIPGIPAVVIPAIPGFTIPAVEVDICEIITQAQSGFDAVLNTVINAALSLVGVDFDQIADELLSKLLGPLEPVFAAIDALKAAAGDIISQITEKLEPLIDGFSDLIDALDNATTFNSMFDNTIEGDRATGPEDMADVLSGTIGEDAMFGMTGSDNITGGGGDFLFGGKGNDVLNSNGDEVYGGGGRDTLNGSDVSDWMDGGTGPDKLFGRNGDDVLFGGDGNDRVSGGNGADKISGGDGNDKLAGGKGRDEMSGGRGADDMKGGSGQDVISGGRGEDIINGGQGHDELTGDQGSDIFVFKNKAGNDTITDFDANDNNEKIDLSAVSEIVDRTDLWANHMTQSGDNVIIDDDNGTMITLENVAMSDLNNADFIF